MGESVLVVTDEHLRNIDLHLWLKVRDLGADAVYVEMIPRKVHGEEPPKPVAEAKKASDVVIAPISKSITHTVTRKEAARRGARVATMSGITEGTLIRTMNVDHELVQRLTNAVADTLDEGRGSEVTSIGTDLIFSIEGRRARRSTGVLVNPGDWENPPCSEAYVAPVEGAANGVVVVDGSVACIGLFTQPVRIVFRNGMVTQIEGIQRPCSLTNYKV